jgi:general L-amino acid transport system permease protein
MSVVSGGDAPPKVAFFNDPKVRSIAVQSALVLVVAYFAWSIFNNTVANLREANIASGFGFLESTAGFDLSFTLIPYSESSTYGRAVVVGILNTMLVAVCGIILATIIGFIVGVMRLSKNWLVSKVAEVYIEVMRNIPLLIQIFIWYKVVLAALPHPRNALSVGGTVFLSNRGITIPKFIWGDGAWLIGVAALVAIAAIWLLRRWARARQEATGEQFPVFLSVAWPADRPAAVGISRRPECRLNSNCQSRATSTCAVALAWYLNLPRCSSRCRSILPALLVRSCALASWR